jgi:hypothetical protein
MYLKSVFYKVTLFGFKTLYILTYNSRIISHLPSSSLVISYQVSPVVKQLDSLVSFFDLLWHSKKFLLAYVHFNFEN